jgi:protein-S-isoprenylcysteine O-methyltransferase Ste14
MGRLAPRLDIPITLAVYAFCLSRPRSDWLYLAGMVVAAAGFSLWIVARVQLGGSFTVRPEARALVTTGLYSRIRNPIYFFSTVGLLAMCLGMRWFRWGGLYTAAVFLIQWRRSRAEAKVLEAAFGEQYLAYKAHTWF